MLKVQAALSNYSDTVNAVRMLPLIIILVLVGLGIVGAGYLSLFRSGHSSNTGQNRFISQWVIAGLVALAVLAFILLIIAIII